jgi:outer membrane protein assembly factor BamB
VGVALIAVIDLGEIPTGQDIDEPPANPWPHRRRALFALAMVLALVTVGGGSAPPPRPLAMAVLAARTGSTVSVAGDRLFVAEQNRFGIHRHVAAYRLTDLEQLWRVELPTEGQALWLLAVDGTLAVTLGRPDDGGRGATTVGLDIATGAVRWRHEAGLDGQTPSGRLLLWSERANSAGAAAGAEPGAAGQTLRAVHADAGDVVWSFDLPADATRSYQFDGVNVTLLAAMLPSGRVELRDLDSGKVLRSQQIGRPSAVPGAGQFAAIVGNLFLVWEASAMVAYGLDRLDLRWRFPFEVGGPAWPIPCGTAVCFITEGGTTEGGQLTAVDPSTGRRKWSDLRWSTVLAEADGYLITSNGGRDDQIVAAVDPDTGQVRRELGSWQELHLDPVDGSMIGIRYGLSRTFVARIDPSRGTRILGVLHNIINRSCWTASPRLLCWRSDNTLGIWQLPG